MSSRINVLILHNKCTPGYFFLVTKGQSLSLGRVRPILSRSASSLLTLRRQRSQSKVPISKRSDSRVHGPLQARDMTGRSESIVPGDRGLSENGGGAGLASAAATPARRRPMTLSSMLEVNSCHERVLRLTM